MAWALQHPVGFICAESGRKNLSAQVDFQLHTLDGDWVVVCSEVLCDNKDSMNQMQLHGPIFWFLRIRR